MQVEICDRVGSELGTEEERIRPIAAGERVAVSADQDIGTIAADQDVVSSRAIENILTVAANQCRVDACLVAHPWIEHDDAEGGCGGRPMGVGDGVVECVLRDNLGRQRTLVRYIDIAAVVVEGQ